MSTQHACALSTPSLNDDIHFTLFQSKLRARFPDVLRDVLIINAINVGFFCRCIYMQTFMSSSPWSSQDVVHG